VKNYCVCQIKGKVPDQAIDTKSSGPIDHQVFSEYKYHSIVTIPPTLSTRRHRLN
jgi:hypothetical protein